MAKIKKKHLLRIGFDEGKALREAMVAMAHDAYAKKGRQAKLEMLQALLNRPEHFVNHDILGLTAKELLPEGEDEGIVLPVLKDKPLDFEVYGKAIIEPGALNQMYTAAKLPVSKAAALMPDAHQGYGLPIGGVLATEGAVIPYAVGVDIGCRMALSVYSLRREHLERNRRNWKELLQTHTFFGAGRGPDRPMDDEVLERDEFRFIDIAKKLKDKAWRQIGSSGSGNHFVEFGLVDITDPDNEWDLPLGTYVGLLSHSGSRALGAGIANHYTKVAMSRTRLARVAKHLAWLDMGSEAGMEYWAAMNLAGDYSSACHRHIHHRISHALGEKPLFVVENHHNFAWKEQLGDGSDVIVHRKGATPAGKGVLGIIPGSMTDPGYIVRGKGNVESINSASHGAGRQLSRSKAKSTITRSAMRSLMNEKRITLIGGGPDEAPLAYKDINQVMSYQHDLVEVIGKFAPKIVRMAGD
ncbi:MAG: RtcB family protein [Bacteroidia bacterium]|nr:RtcB family protein [Bacteroidia bacterium]